MTYLAPVYSAPLLPDQSARVDFFSHGFELAQRGPVPCWSAITAGFRNYDQPEVFLTAAGQAAGDGAPPPALYNILEAVARFVAEGAALAHGNRTRFGTPQLGFDGVVYLHAQAVLDRLPIPPGALCAKLATTDELSAAATFGITRLIGRWGLQTPAYPCPAWSDLHRPPIDFDHTRAVSTLARHPLIQLVYSSVARQDAHLLLVLDQHDRATLSHLFKTQLAADTTALLGMGVDPDGDGLLVWLPDQDAITAITPPTGQGHRLSGAFLRVHPLATAPTWNHHEDGFALDLTLDAWNTLRDAITSGTPTQLDLGPDRALILDFRDHPKPHPVTSSPPPPRVPAPPNLVASPTAQAPAPAAQVTPAPPAQAPAQPQRQTPPSPAPPAQAAAPTQAAPPQPAPPQPAPAQAATPPAERPAPASAPTARASDAIVFHPVEHLTDADTRARNTADGDLDRYTQALQDALTRVLARFEITGDPPGFAFMAQLTLEPTGRVGLQLGYRSVHDIDDAVIQALSQALLAVKAPIPGADNLSLQITADIWGGV